MAGAAGPAAVVDLESRSPKAVISRLSMGRARVQAKGWKD